MSANKPSAHSLPGGTKELGAHSHQFQRRRTYRHRQPRRPCSRACEPVGQAWRHRSVARGQDGVHFVARPQSVERGGGCRSSSRSALAVYRRSGSNRNPTTRCRASSMKTTSPRWCETGPGRIRPEPYRSCGSRSTTRAPAAGAACFLPDGCRSTLSTIRANGCSTCRCSIRTSGNSAMRRSNAHAPACVPICRANGWDWPQRSAPRRLRTKAVPAGSRKRSLPI